MSKGDPDRLVGDLSDVTKQLRDSVNTAWLLAAKADDENGRIQQRLADLEDLMDKLLEQQAKLLAALVNGLEEVAGASSFTQLHRAVDDLILDVEGNPPPPSGSR